MKTYDSLAWLSEEHIPAGDDIPTDSVRSHLGNAITCLELGSHLSTVTDQGCPKDYVCIPKNEMRSVMLRLRAALGYIDLAIGTARMLDDAQQRRLQQYELGPYDK